VGRTTLELPRHSNRLRFGTGSHAPVAHPVTHEKGGSKTRQWIATAVRQWLGEEREPRPAGAAQNIFEAGSLIVRGACRRLLRKPAKEENFQPA
jgi:hypothetical protein